MENKYIEKLRRCQKRNVYSESWNGNLETMKKEIFENGIKDFIKYPTIVKTMARGNERENENYNKQHIREMISKGGNVELWDNVVEFGGGFGSLAKILKSVYKNIKRYLIYDFEEFGILQQYYLELNDVKGVEHTHEIKRLERKIGQLNGHNTFLAMWSLSETPMDVRDKVMWLVRGFDTIFISYNSQFDGIDNVTYFKNIRETFSEYEWTVWDASVEDSQYILGRKKC